VRWRIDVAIEQRAGRLVRSGEGDPHTSENESVSGSEGFNSELSAREPLLTRDIPTPSVQPATQQLTRTAKPKQRVALKVPALQPWSGNQKEDDNVTVFLPRLTQYLLSQNVTTRHHIDNVLPFLKGKAFQLWEVRLRTLQSQNTPVTWDDFTTYMKSTFGSLAPERTARHQFDKLVQTGNVFGYVTEMKKLVDIMRPLPMVCPGEVELVNHFIRNAKPDV